MHAMMPLLSGIKPNDNLPTRARTNDWLCVTTTTIAHKAVRLQLARLNAAQQHSKQPAQLNPTFTKAGNTLPLLLRQAKYDEY